MSLSAPFALYGVSPKAFLINPCLEYVCPGTSLAGIFLSPHNPYFFLPSTTVKTSSFNLSTPSLDNPLSETSFYFAALIAADLISSVDFPTT